VRFAVHLLDVEQEQVRLAEQRLEEHGIRLAAGIDADMQGLVLAGIHQSHEEIRLHGALPAAESHAAAGIAEKSGILADDAHDLLDLVLPPGQAAGRGGALGGALAAARAARKVAPDDLILFRNGPVPADLAATTAAGTQVRKKHELGRRGLRFGIAAPQAAQRTALEKNGGPQSGAVMHGHALDVVEGSSWSHGYLARPDRPVRRKT